MAVLPVLFVFSATFAPVAALMKPVSAATNPVGASAGSLTVTPIYNTPGDGTTLIPGSPTNLTTQGNEDWAVWGTGTNALLSPNFRKSGASAISDLTDIGAPSILRRALGGLVPGQVPFRFTWSDGPASHASETTGVATGLQHDREPGGSAGYGFSFTVPAATTTQRLMLWVTAHGGVGRLEVAWSGDPSTPAATDTSVGAGGLNSPGVYQIDFAAASEGQSLIVRWVLDHDVSGANASASNAAIHAVALSSLAPPPTPDFTISAVPDTISVVQGGSADVAVSTTSINGGGTVGLTAASAPNSGLTSTIASSIASGTGTALHVSAAANAPVGGSDVVLMGQMGSAQHQATVHVTVTTGDPIQPASHQVVNSALDSEPGDCTQNDCTLREAIMAANNGGSGPHVIDFAPALAGQVIHLLSQGPLPAITVPLTIQGGGTVGGGCQIPTQPIQVVGPTNVAFGNGFEFTAGAFPSVVQGLSISGFAENGIKASSSTPNVTQLSVICNVIHDNAGAGVQLVDVSGAAIGGAFSGGNRIYGNGGAGIALIQANTSTRQPFGDTFDGNLIYGNTGPGIDLGGDGSLAANDAGDADAGVNGLSNHPILYNAETPGDGSGVVNGTINTKPGVPQHITLYASDTCTTRLGGDGASILASFDLKDNTAVPNGVDSTPDANGDAAFTATVLKPTQPSDVPFPTSGYVSAIATPIGTGAFPDGTSEFSGCVLIGSGNDSWPSAASVNGGSAHGAISYDGQARWYKFTVHPNQQITIDLDNLPADYDMLLFTDIKQAYDQLNGADLTQVSAEASGKGGNSLVSGKGGNALISGKGGNTLLSGKGGNALVSGKGGNAIISSLGFSGDVFSGKGNNAIFSGKGGNALVSGSGSSPKYSPEAYSSAQISTLIALSDANGNAPEQITVNSFNNSGNFYIRVAGAGGAFDPSTLFHVTVTASPTVCDAVVDSTAGTDTGLPTADTSQPFDTIILTDPTDAFLNGYDATMFTNKLNALAARPEVNGKVVDVSQNPRIQSLLTQANQNPDCPFAENLLADALKRIIDSYRPNNPNLKYVVLIGGDNVIPFFRYPDTADLGPENSYLPPVKPTSPSEASLGLNYVLSQDAYGANVQVAHDVSKFPVPNLAVGRLVENASDAAKVIDAYMTKTTALDGTAGTGLIHTPSTSLSTGYDFMTDAANAVAGSFSAGLGSGSTNDSLINDTWTAADLNTKLLGSRHDLVFLAGHFSANEALAADFTTTLKTAALAASTTDFTNTIVFSQGCHSGYNIVDGDAITGITQPLDWPQAFAQKGATLIAGTGFQYGDTRLIAYSEQIYANFADELRTGTGAVSVGQALIQAKQDYLRETPDINGTDTKALLESTLFGLPMLSVNMPGARLPAHTTVSVIGTTTPVTSGPGGTLGLSTAPISITTTSGADQIGPGSGGNYLTGPNGLFTSKPNEPVLPLISKDVTVTDETLRGVGFIGGDYHDTSPVSPLISSAATELGGAPTTFTSPVFYPTRVATANYYDALGNGATRLQITPVQHQSGTGGFIRRVFDTLDLQLFYSNTKPDATITGGFHPALAAAPSILDVNATDDGSGSVRFDAHVAVDPAAGIQDVWITYTFGSRWDSVHLTKDGADATHWSKTQSLGGHTAADLRYIVQAVNGVGMVSLDANGGQFYSIAQANAAVTHATDLSVSTTSSHGVFGSTISVTADLSGTGTISGQVIHFGVGAASATGTTDVNGHAIASLDLTSLPGVYSVTAVFEGDATNDPSSDFKAFTIDKLGTGIALSGPGNGQSGADSGVIATLTDASSTHKAIVGRTVWFVVSENGNASNAFSRSALTDGSGKARLGVVGLVPGTYAVAAYFGGTINLLPGSATITPIDTTYLSSNASKAYVVDLTTQSITFGPLGGKTYGDADFAVSATGGGSGQPVTLTASGNCTIASGPQVHITGAGSCTITAHQSAGGTYAAAADVPQTFAIARKSITITPMAGQSKVYGSGDPVLTYTYSALVGSDTPSVFTGTLGRVSGEGATTYGFTIGSLKADPNYTLVLSPAPVTFAITPKTVTVTPNPGQSKVFGAADPVLTYSNTALGNGDNQSVFSGSLTRASGENVGTYAISRGSLVVNANYTLSMAAGTVNFTITPAPSTVQINNLPVNAGFPGSFTPTYAKTGTGGTSVTSNTTAVCTASGTTVTFASAGTCTLLPAISANGNYAPQSGPAQTFTIAKKAVTIGFTGNLFWSAGSTTAAVVTFSGQVTPAVSGTIAANNTVDFQLFDPANPSVKVGDCFGTITVAGFASCTTATPGLAVGNWIVVMTIPTSNIYLTAPDADPVVLTVYQANPAKYASGAGSIVDNSPTTLPVKVSTIKTKGTFGFAVSYKTGTTPQGVAIYNFRATDGYDYIFTTSSWTGGGLSFGTGTTASFSNKCSVTVVNPATHKVVAGLGGTNFTCRFDISDGSPDKLSFNAWTSTGTLYHQAGTSAALISLSSGSIVVKK